MPVKKFIGAVVYGPKGRTTRPSTKSPKGKSLGKKHRKNK